MNCNKALVFYMETVNKVAIDVLVCSCAESSVAVRRRIMQVGRILLVALVGLACWKTFTVEGSYRLLYVLLYNFLVSRTVQVDKMCQHTMLLCVFFIAFPSLSRCDILSERGWDTWRVVSGNHRFHYLRRREASSEGGYYTCNIIHDINNPAGLYIPS